ncbi:MAG TPA: OmpW family outer membrane protein [Thermoanaerobaculia bacterium]|nr:OmpW family outer membrane protein [Thermoanaerobaculia bacterium]
MKSAAIMALLILCAVPLAAQERNINLTVFIGQAEITGENDLDGFETDFEDANALGAAVDVFFNNYVSVEAAAFGIRTEGALVFEDTAAFDLGNFNITPITLGAKFHVLGNRRIDPYVGAGAAYVIGDDFFTPDLDTAGVGRIAIDSELTYYVNAGIGIQLTEGFGLVIDGRYIPYEPVTSSGVTGVERDFDLTTQILSAGVRLRF